MDQNGFETGFIRAKTRAGIEGLRFHDLRGSAATNFCLADIGKREIAEIMAWEEKTVDRIIKRYVGRSAATKALILKLNKAERRT